MLIGWKPAVNDRKIASLRYRVETPVRALQALGHAVEVFDPHRADEYDVVIFAKTYSVRDRALAGRVRARGGRVVFDLCDNHFFNPRDVPKYRQVREELLDMLSLAQQVVCTTPALAEVVREQAPWAATPVVIGDAVERLSPARASLEPFEGTRLLWFGSHGSPNAASGMSDLLLIQDRLAEAAARGPVELVVCSNSRAKYEEVIAPLPVRSRYLDWTLDGFRGVLASADAVIIPISQNPFTACKTHNRLSMSLYAGTPVIADSIESYLEFAPFCTLDDWSGGLERIAADPAAERARAAGARAYIEEHWTTEALALKWQEALGLEPQAAQAPALNGEAAPMPALESLRCQGGVDHRGVGRLTGWARVPSDPSRKLTVRLEQHGSVLATAVADLPRPDLAQAGFADSACGFSLPAPTGASDIPYELVVEENGWRFDQAPFHLAFNGGGAFRVAANGAAAHEPLRAAAAAAEPAPAELSPAAAVSARAVQNELLGELERISDLMEEARDAAARLVVAAGDDAALGRRLLGLFKSQVKPGLSSLIGWKDETRPSAPLN